MQLGIPDGLRITPFSHSRCTPDDNMCVRNQTQKCWRLFKEVSDKTKELIVVRGKRSILY